MAWLGWPLGANIFRTGFTAPQINSRVQLTRKYVRCLCDTTPSFRDFTFSRGLEDITVVDNTRGAVRVVQTLLELPKEQPVSWSTQLCKPPRPKSPDEFLLSVSAYAGEKVNFGNGPHLFICGEDSQENESIWNLLRKYFHMDECGKVWFDYSQSMRALALVETIPKGFVGDVIQMTRLYRDKQKKIEVDAVAKAIMTKANLKKSNDLWEKNDVPKDDRVKRAWEEADSIDYASITDQWIARACYDASLIHRLDNRLRKLLTQTSIHGDAYMMPAGTSSMHRNESVFNQMQAYETFFRPLTEAFHAIETEGLPVDFGILKQVASKEEQTKRLLEAQFRQWASTVSEDALYMDVSSTKQLRQLLFAPCENIHNVKSKMEQSSKFKINRSKMKDVLGTQELKDKKEVVIKGAGINAVSHTKQGWPSLSASALQKALEEYKRNPSKNVPEGFPEAMESLLESLDIGKRLKWYATDLDLTPIQDKDGRIRMKYKLDPYTGKLVTSAHGKDWEPLMQQCTSPSHGNDLIHVQFPDLNMRTLTQLSGCTSLYGRLNSGGDPANLLAYEVFMKSNVEDSNVPLPEVSREQRYAALMLDNAMCTGGDINIVQKRVGCSKEEAVQLIRDWYELHPGVLKWRTEREAFITQQGFAETYMGRRRKITKRHVGDGIGFIVNGTSAELVAGSVLGLRHDERIKSLRWSIAHVDSNTIVLEGPSYAADSILEFLEKVASRPAGFELDAPLQVELYHMQGKGDQS